MIIDSVLSFSIKNKLIIALMTLALVVGGIYSMFQIPLDTQPDITNNQVQVITVSPNLGTEDIEQFVTYAVELSMANLPKVTEIRSVSRFGLSVVTIVFEDNMGTYLPRQLVGEALQEVKENIPKRFGQPYMAPISSGLGEIYQYVLEVDEAHRSQYDARELRSIQDWIVKRQMAMTPGVVEVNSFGGYVKQYEIAINPTSLLRMGVTMSEIYVAVEQNNQNTGGAYIEKNHQVNYIRGEGLARNSDDLKHILIKTVEGKPILLKDVATVSYGSAIRYGAFTRNGQGEAVGGIVMMLKGENANEVIRNTKVRIAEIQKSLPEGITIVPFLDRSEMIKQTMSTVAENLALGALIVIFVLVLILGQWRGGLIVASTIPLSLLFAFIMMHLFGVWANLMSLGAIDFGILIDGAVIIVESMMYALSSKKYMGQTLTQDTRDALALKSSSKMMSSAFFGQLIIMIVFIPILVLTGIEGKMFTPMALTFSFAILGVLVLCLTYVPMMSALLLRAPTTSKKGLGDQLVRRLERFYTPILLWGLRQKKVVLIMASLLLVLSGVVFSRMGAEFLPKLDEGNLAMHMGFRPGTALSDVTHTATQIEHRLLTHFPDEIKSIQTRFGVSDIPTDPMPVDVGDCFIILYPKKHWTKAKSKDDLLAKIDGVVHEFPGVSYEFSQPIEMRFNELLTGVREDLALKIYGDDLTVLAQKAQEVKALISPLKGVADLRVEATKGLPQITIEYDRQQLAKYGVTIQAINTIVETSFSGRMVGEVYEGEKRFDVVLRLNQENRQSIEDIKTLFITTDQQKQVPLSELATISYKPGPMQISRDNTNRRIYVGVNVRGRDVRALVREISATLDRDLDLPPGYYIRYGGAFENLERATNRLKVVVPMALALIFLLVFLAIRSLPQTLMIYMAIPFSAVGGIFFLVLRGLPFSLSAGVGFIVLFGVAVMNGMVLINSFNELKAEGLYTLKEIIMKGSVRRIRPILLTASTDIIGFLPMALSTSAGAEVQRPLATVVIGGMFTATILTLLVLPVLYSMVSSRGTKKRRVSKVRLLPVLLLGLLSLPLFVSAQTVVEPDSVVVALEHTPNRTLSIDEAVARAVQNYPSIQEAKYSVEAQENLLGTAVNLGTTTLSTSRDEYKDGRIGTQTLLNISQDEIDLFGMYSQRRQQKTALKRAEQVLRQTQGQLVLDVLRTYHQVQNRARKIQIYTELNQIYARFAQASKLRYETGETTKIEYLTALNKLGEVQLDLSYMKAEVEGAYLALNQYVMEEHPFVVSLEETEIREDRTTLVSNHEIALSSLEEELAQRNYATQRAGLLPKFKASYKLQRVDGTSGYSGFELGLSLPLFSGQRSRSKAAKHQWQAKSAEYQRVKRTMLLQINQQELRLTSLEQRLAFYHKQSLPLARERIEVAQLAYKLGEIDYIQFIQNIESSMQTYLEFADVQTTYQDVMANLQYLEGTNTTPQTVLRPREKSRSESDPNSETTTSQNTLTHTIL